MSPAMATSVSDKLQDMEWIVGPIDARAPKPNTQQGDSYRKRALPDS